MNLFARFFSWLFHPLLMPMYAAFILFNTNNYLAYTVPLPAKKIIFLIVFTITYLLPSLTSILLLSRKKINSLYMNETRERRIPFLITCVYYVICFYVLQKIPMAHIFGYAILGASVVILLCFFINLKWKISIHTAGIGGLMGLLFAFSQQMQFNFLIPIVIIAIVAGAVGTARLLMDAHVPSQIYMGFIAGFAVEWTFLRMLERFA